MAQQRNALFSLPLSIAVLCASASPLWGAKTAKRARKSSADANALVCGPICVHRVLQLYGQQREMIELVREIQWPELEKGASLSSLASALEKRGIRALGVRSDMGGPPRWRFPVIAHLNGTGDSIGHYVVLTPSSPDDGSGCRVWDPSLRAYLKPADYASLNFSGNYLVTSPTAVSIRDLESSTTISQLEVWSGRCAIVLSIALVVVAATPSTRLFRRTRRR